MTRVANDYLDLDLWTSCNWAAQVTGGAGLRHACELGGYETFGNT
jgi:hypothetical protein